MAPARRRLRRPRRKRSRKAAAPRRVAPRKSAMSRRTPRRAAGREPEAVTRRRAAPVSSPPVEPPPRPAPTEAERRLLEIARQITDLGREPGAAGRALGILASAHAPDSPLPGAIFAAWVASRDDKTAALALAWAREQVRLALQELLERGPRLPPRRPPSPETLAWLLLAGAEAICQEPPSAAADRLRALLELAGPGEPWPAPPSPPLGRRELR